MTAWVMARLPAESTTRTRSGARTNVDILRNVLI